MSSPRLLVYAAMALGCVAFPASSLGALKTQSPFPTPIGYGDDGSGSPLWTADGVLSPGETVNVNFPLSDDGDPEGYPGDSTGIVYPTGAFLTIGSTPSPMPFSAVGASTQGQNPISVGVSSNLQCGTAVPLRLDLSGPSQQGGTTSFNYKLPTGAPGAFHRTPSEDVGDVVYDGGTKDSVVKIARDTDLAKGIRVHIDQIDHQYSTQWITLTLVSPSGKEAVLITRTGATQGSGATPNKIFKNLTFSWKPVNGVAPKQATDAAIDDDFTNVVVQPKDSFDVFDGEPLTGDWKLRIKDISDPKEPRRLPRGGRTLSGQEMIDIGGWSLDTAGAVCGQGSTLASAGPSAWFGDEPFFVDPAGGTVLDGSASTDPSFGGSIVKYEWDLDGNLNNGSAGFEVDGGASATTVFPPTSQGTRTIRLRVTDDQGNSSIVQRTVIISKIPVISGIDANPTLVLANAPVELTAHATDADLPNGSNLIYTWDLNNDGTFGDANGATASKTWPDSGKHVVRVKVTDQAGAYATFYTRVTVSNTAPEAHFTVGASPVIVGEPVTFDGSTSTDVDGTVAMYSWDLNGDGAFGDVLSDQPTATWTFNNAGINQVRLMVTDNTGGTGETDTLVNVTGRPVPEGTASPESPLKGETVTFNAASSHDSDPSGSIAKYEWDLDGNNTFEISGTTAVTATKAYPNAGTIAAKLRVTDDSGATAMQIIPITVRNPIVVTPPVIPPTTPGGGTGGTGTGGGTGGGTTVPPTGPGGEATPPGFDNVPPAVDGSKLKDKFADTPVGETIGESGQTEDGFVGKIAASSKAKGSKVYKKGIAVKLVANDASTLVLKVMITPKDAKTLGLKFKKNTAIGSGKLVTKGAGTAKFVVTFTKKYQRYVKKAKKTKVTFRAVVTSKAGGSELVLGRDITLVK